MKSRESIASCAAAAPAARACAGLRRRNAVLSATRHENPAPNHLIMNPRLASSKPVRHGEVKVPIKRVYDEVPRAARGKAARVARGMAARAARGKATRCDGPRVLFSPGAGLAPDLQFLKAAQS